MREIKNIRVIVGLRVDLIWGGVNARIINEEWNTNFERVMIDRVVIHRAVIMATDITGNGGKKIMKEKKMTNN